MPGRPPCPAGGRFPAYIPHPLPKVVPMNRDLPDKEVEELERQTWLPPSLVYRIVQEEGEQELERPVGALWWSGLAAGMAIGMSVFGQAIFHNLLPDTEWRPLVASIGNTFGFLIVILSRHQLFTENTITPILPLMVRRSWRCLYAVGRLWLVVAAANLVGAFVFALFWSYSGVADHAIVRAMVDLGHEAMSYGWLEMLSRATAAGFLMASLVWMLPSSKGAEFLSIMLVTYLMAIGGLAHIVSGGVEVLILLLAGQAAAWDVIFNFGVPVFVGNVIGGTALFSVVVYAQVRREIKSHGDKN